MILEIGNNFDCLAEMTFTLNELLLLNSALVCYQNSEGSAQHKEQTSRLIGEVYEQIEEMRKRLAELAHATDERKEEKDD